MFNVTAKTNDCQICIHSVPGKAGYALDVYVEGVLKLHSHVGHIAGLAIELDSLNKTFLDEAISVKGDANNAIAFIRAKQELRLLCSLLAETPRLLDDLSSKAAQHVEDALSAREEASK